MKTNTVKAETAAIEITRLSEGLTASTTHCTRCGEALEEPSAAFTVCDSCYTIRSSCCPEFGPDDLWQ